MKGLHIDTAGRFLANKQAESYPWGGAMGAQHPLDRGNLWISGGFKAPTGAEPSPRKEKNVKPPLAKFLNTPLLFKYIFFYFKSSLSSFMISFLCFICLSPSFQSYLIGCMYGVCLRTPFINENKKLFCSVRIIVFPSKLSGS